MFSISFFPLFKWRPRRRLKHQPVIQTDRELAHTMEVCAGDIFQPSGQRKVKSQVVMSGYYACIFFSVCMWAIDPVQGSISQVVQGRYVQERCWMPMGSFKLCRPVQNVATVWTARHHTPQDQAEPVYMPVFLFPYGKNIHPVVCVLSMPRYKKRFIYLANQWTNCIN
jgi:hypothetical protein